jgi:predicted flap endonuclease-1-like 5' DNA nuclease
MISFVMEVFLIVSATVLVTYFTMYFYLLRENNKKFYNSMHDLNNDMKKLHIIERGIDNIPNKVQGIVDQTEENINKHTDKAIEIYQQKLISTLDQKFEQFDHELIQMQKTELIDQSFREDIETLIHKKMDSILDKMEREPKSTEGIERTFQSVSHNINHFTKVLQKIESSGVYQQKGIEILHEKVHQLLKKYSSPEPAVSNIVAMKPTVPSVEKVVGSTRTQLRSQPKPVATPVNEIEEPFYEWDSKDLTMIKGIGKFTQRILDKYFKIKRLSHVAALDDKTIQAIHKRIFFEGKVYREQWREQAQALLDKHNKKAA